MFFYVTSTPFLFDFVTFKWERKHNCFNLNSLQNSTPLKIVVLGSGYNHDSELASTNLLGAAALSRIVEGVKIAKAFPNSIIITSGYSASGKTPGATVLRNAAVELGVRQDKILTQAQPHNTNSEAEYFAANFYSKYDTVVLVTSAVHMPRAYQHFKNAGVDVLYAAPCDYLTFNENLYSFQSFVPRLSTWEKIQRLNKEIIGYYFNL